MYVNWRFIFVVLIIIVLIFSFTGLLDPVDVDIPVVSWLGEGLYDVFSIPLGWISSIGNSVTGVWRRVFDADDVMDKNEKLKKRVAELEREILYLESSRRENIRLRKLLDFKEKVPYEVKGARVIGYGPSNWENRILINIGRDEGIEEKMPVITYNGILLGRVDFTGAHSSQIIPLNDSDFVVGAVIAGEEERAIGLLRGQHEKKNINIMDNIAWDAEIEEGDKIVTSGLSDSYPRGLLIGEVIGVEPDNYGLSQKAEVELFIKSLTPEEVLVISDF